MAAQPTAAEWEVLENIIAATLAGIPDKVKLDIPRPEDFSGEADDVQPFVQCVKSYFIASGNN